jgi:hypothetical protein
MGAQLTMPTQDTLNLECSLQELEGEYLSKQERELQALRRVTRRTHNTICSMHKEKSPTHHDN